VAFFSTAAKLAWVPNHRPGKSDVSRPRQGLFDQAGLYSSQFCRPSFLHGGKFSRAVGRATSKSYLEASDPCFLTEHWPAPVNFALRGVRPCCPWMTPATGRCEEQSKRVRWPRWISFTPSNRPRGIRRVSAERRDHVPGWVVAGMSSVRNSLTRKPSGESLFLREAPVQRGPGWKRSHTASESPISSLLRGKEATRSG
jgi:hypothetical protein